MGYSKFSDAQKQSFSSSEITNKINPHELPAYPMQSYMPTASSAVNEVHINDNSFRQGFKPQPTSLAAIHRQVEEQTLTAALHGFKTRQFGSIDPSTFDYSEDEASSKAYFSKEFYENIRASSLYGYQEIDTEARSANTQPLRNTGASSFARNTGYERDRNLAISASAAHGLSKESSAAVPQVKHVRLGANILAPIMTAPVNK